MQCQILLAYYTFCLQWIAEWFLLYYLFNKSYLLVKDASKESYAKLQILSRSQLISNYFECSEKTVWLNKN